MSRPSWLSRAYQRIRATAGLDTNDDRLYWPTSTLGGKAFTGEYVTAEGALTLSTYYACVRNIADDFGKLPTHAFDEDEKGNKTRARKHPTWPLVHSRPNPDMGAMAFKQLMVHWYLGWGRGSAEIEFDRTGYPVALWPIHPSRIRANRDEKKRLVYDVRVLDGDTYKDVRLQSYQVFDFHGLGADGITGYSLGVQARESIALGLAAGRYAGRFYANDATPSIVLVHPKDIKNDAMENIRSRWAELYKGHDKAHNMAILQGGMDVKQLSIDPEKAQLLLARRDSVREICGWFRMHQSKVTGEGGATEAENSAYYSDTIQPLVTLWDQECNWKLLDEDERERMVIETNMDAQLRGLPLTRVNVQRTRIFSGTMSVNEARRLENNNDIGPEGDEFWFPLNMQSLRKAYENIDNPPPAAPPPFKPGKPDSGEDTEPDPDQDDQPDTSQPPEAHAEIFRPLFEAAAARCVEKQCKAVERKAGEKPEAWSVWARKFFAEQAGYWRDALEPVIRAYQHELGHTSAAYPTFNSFTESMRRDAEYAYKNGSTTALVARWRSELAAAITQAVMGNTEDRVYG